MSIKTLTGQQVADEALAGWVNLSDGLHTRIKTKNFTTGLTILNAIGAAAEEMDHHPDLDLRYGHLDIRLISHDAGGLTHRDIRLARTITEIAARAGVELDGGMVSRIELALDSPASAGVLPFWRAVLGMEEYDGQLADPYGALPNLWFQQSGSEEPRQRWHFDVWVDPAEVQPRIDAALEAGGTVVSDQSAPSFWVLADAEGNRVCLCSWQDRG